MMWLVLVLIAVKVVLFAILGYLLWKDPLGRFR